jgi:hypothetical protein
MEGTVYGTDGDSGELGDFVDSGVLHRRWVKYLRG